MKATGGQIAAKTAPLPARVGELRRAARRRLAAAGIATAGLDADLLVAHALGRSREALLASHPDEPVPDDALRRVEELLARRCARQPLAHITGEKEFFGRLFRVGPGVLVPRPETETLVETALELLDEGACRSPLMLDFGVGSGAILLSLLAERPCAEGVGIDRSTGAVACARENARRLGVGKRAALLAGDWDAPLGPGAEERFDLVVSNPPYLPSGAIGSLMPEVARHEPRLALDGGVRGLDAYPVLARAALRLLRPGGALAVELGAGQAPAVADVFRRAGFIEVRGRRDLAGIERVVCARRAG